MGKVQSYIDNTTWKWIRYLFTSRLINFKQCIFSFTLCMFSWR